VRDLVKLIGAPGSITFFIVAASAGLLIWWLRPSLRRFARIWLVALTATYGLLGMPVVAAAIANQLPHLAPVPDSALAQVDRLVIFDGDNRRGRARMAISLVQAHHPREVYVLGMGWLVEALDTGGVPRYSIRHDVRPTNTLEQVQVLAALESAHAVARTIVVVSRLQAPRTRALLDASGSTALIVASPIDTEPPTDGAITLVPTYTALRVSRDAIYEHFALWFYRWKGWIR